MTHPTTEQSIRERLARALWDHVEASEGPPHNGPYDEQPEHWKDEYRGQVDAILAELQEPSEGMDEAGWKTIPYGVYFTDADKTLVPEIVKCVYRVMIRHIRDGGK